MRGSPPAAKPAGKTRAMASRQTGGGHNRMGLQEAGRLWVGFTRPVRRTGTPPAKATFAPGRTPPPFARACRFSRRFFHAPRAPSRFAASLACSESRRAGIEGRGARFRRRRKGGVRIYWQRPNSSYTLPAGGQTCPAGHEPAWPGSNPRLQSPASRSGSFLCCSRCVARCGPGRKRLWVRRV